MKKTALLMATLLALALPAVANPVGIDDARKVAVNFWNSHHPADAKPVADMTARTFAGLEHLYVFANGMDGFVVVAADDCVTPVLAYAFDAPFPEALHPALAYWLRGYEAQIAEAVEAAYVPHASVAAQWETLLYQPVPLIPTLLTTVPALLSTHWDQDSPFNMYCPVNLSLNCQTVVGCVATAMAQIMKYWNYPSFGQGSHSYVPFSLSELGAISADFGSTTYLWQFMPDRLFEGSFDYQKEAVAMLSFHCGVAVNMMYGCSSQGGSGAYSRNVLDAMVDYFKYDPAIHDAYRYQYNDSAWCALLDSELETGRPLYYTGSDTSGGHAFVLDGSDTAQRYHFNWGWNGYGDGFYHINNLAPGINSPASGGNATYTFNLYQDIILGIQPGSVETFDTVDYYDSICNDSRYIRFREYNLQVANMDTLLRHLDTIFRYHLKIIDRKHVTYEPNGGNGNLYAVVYCPATGITLPECTFSKTNCRFLGWCRRSNGQSDTLQPGTHVMLNTNRHYYAIWEDTTIVSISDVKPGESLLLAPSPVVDNLSISLADGSDARVVVFDALGRHVARLTLRGGKGQISLRHLPSGAYIVQVSTASGKYNRRIIKQ